MKIKLLLTTFILLVVYMFFKQIDLYFYIFPEKFDSSLWRTSYTNFVNYPGSEATQAYKELDIRKKMVYDLIRSKELLNKNKKEVIEIIGLEENKLESYHWKYWLKSVIVDDKWLAVEFDSKGYVVEVKVYED
jgi:hypothetical protein